MTKTPVARCGVAAFLVAALQMTMPAEGSPGTAGSLRLWGREVAGELGGPADLGRCSSLALGCWQSATITHDGTVACWGANDSGQSSVPSTIGRCKDIACGGDWGGHCVAVRMDGSVVAWGDNRLGQTTVPTNTGSCKAVAAGYFFSMALRVNGSVACWGDNSFGQCSPPAGATNCSTISAGWDHALAIQSNGTVLAWGRNDSGQCSIPSALGPCSTVTSKRRHCLAVRADGLVRAWGANEKGQCEVPTDLGQCTQVAAGFFFSAALRVDGTVRAWGDNTWGQCTIPPDLAPCSRIAAGWDHMGVITDTPSLIPNSGVHSGGTSVSIFGRGFESPMSVMIGLEPATEVQVLSSTHVVIRTPRGRAGPAPVIIQCAGRAQQAENFNFHRSCDADLDEDGQVDTGDIAVLLLQYGPCTAGAGYPPQTPERIVDVESGAARHDESPLDPATSP